jgi:hypothetical protein
MANYFSSLWSSLPASKGTTFVSGREVLPNEVRGDGFLSNSQPFFELLSSLRPKHSIDHKANFEKAISDFNKKCAKGGNKRLYSDARITLGRQLKSSVDFAVDVGVRYGREMARTSRCWIQEMPRKAYGFARHNPNLHTAAINLVRSVMVVTSGSTLTALFPFAETDRLIEMAYNFLLHMHHYTQASMHALESGINHTHNYGTMGLQQASQNSTPVFIESYVQFQTSPLSPENLSYAALVLFVHVVIVVGCLALQVPVEELIAA